LAGKWGKNGVICRDAGVEFCGEGEPGCCKYRGGRVFEGRRHRFTSAWRVGQDGASKTGQRGDHRLWRGENLSGADTDVLLAAERTPTGQTLREVVFPHPADLGADSNSKRAKTAGSGPGRRRPLRPEVALKASDITPVETEANGRASRRESARSWEKPAKPREGSKTEIGATAESLPKN